MKLAIFNWCLPISELIMKCLRKFKCSIILALLCKFPTMLKERFFLSSRSEYIIIFIIAHQLVPKVWFIISFLFSFNIWNLLLGVLLYAWVSAVFFLCLHILDYFTSFSFISGILVINLTFIFKSSFLCTYC